MTINIPLQDLKRIHHLLEDLNDLLHQPDYYLDSKTVERFADEHYKEVRDLYYDTVWNLLPKAEQEKIL